MGKVSCVLPFCSLSPRPSYDLLGIWTRAPSHEKSGLDSGICGFQGAPAGCRPDARSPAQPPAPRREQEGALLHLALSAFYCTVPALRVHVPTPGRDWEVSKTSPCQVHSCLAVPSCQCAHQHRDQLLFPVQGWEVSQTHPGRQICTPADGYWWPRSVEETYGDPPVGHACAGRHCRIKVSVLFGALSVDECTYCHHAPCEAQKPAPWDQPGGALSSRGGTNKELVSDMGLMGARWGQNHSVMQGKAGNGGKAWCAWEEMSGDIMLIRCNSGEWNRGRAYIRATQEAKGLEQKAQLQPKSMPEHVPGWGQANAEIKDFYWCH